MITDPFLMPGCDKIDSTIYRNTLRNITNSEDWYQLHLKTSSRLLVWV